MVTKIGRFVELKDQPAAKEIGCVFTLEAVKVIRTAGLYSTLEENQETMLHTVKLESEWRDQSHNTQRRCVWPLDAVEMEPRLLTYAPISRRISSVSSPRRGARRISGACSES